MVDLSASTPVPTMPRGSLGRLERLKTPTGSIAIAVVVLVAWQLSSASFLVAAPLVTLQVLWDGISRGWMVDDAAATFQAVSLGFGVALVLGLAAGIPLGLSRHWRSVFEPIILSVNAIPKITLYPILLLTLGYGLESRVAMSAIHGIFPLLINVMTAIKDINPTYVKTGRSLQANWWQMLVHIYLPAIAPAFVVGTRIAFSLAILGVVFSEVFLANRGLGMLIRDSYNLANVSKMFAVILLLFIISFVGNLALWAVERRLRGE